jgi:hypothetical protein
VINGPVPLERYFSPVSKIVDESDESDEQDFRSFFSKSKRIGWEDLEGEFRCVILAEAGAGKSFEMETRARHVVGLGRLAFFIRLEDIEDDFETAFEVGSEDAFNGWLDSDKEAWFFLDSIDEARLESPAVFAKAIKRFAKRIKSASQRARVFISGRPYAWRARSDRAMVERYLPFEKPKSQALGEKDSDKSESALRVYSLDPLDENDIRTFANYRETPQVDRLILDLQRTNLMSMAARPFDLEGILAKWNFDQTLDSRLQLLQHNIDNCLKEIDPDRAQRQPLNREKARQGARLLAAAVILTGKAGICVPDSSHPQRGINAETVLGDWNPSDVQALLERGIFNDVLYGLVRFRHRDVRELLAAEFFSEKLTNGGFRVGIESLFFRQQYGHLVITPRLRPILPWLILFDENIRSKALKIAPEIAVEGGDAAHFPFPERRDLLNDIVIRIAENEDDHAPRDNSAIARIADSDLSGEALRLIKAYRDNDDAIFFLGRLVWQGEMAACVPALSPIAADPARNIYARIAATRAVMTCGTRDQRDYLWSQLIKSSDRLSRQLIAEVLEDADADITSVDFLLSSIKKLEVYEPYETFGLCKALHVFVDRLPLSAATVILEPLVAMVGGLNDYLDCEPYIEHRECQVSEEFLWLLGPATHAVERLVSVRSEAALSSAAASVMLKIPAARLWRGEDFDDYKSNLNELVPAWERLNDALFWQSVEEARGKLEKSKSERLVDDWPVQWVGHFWIFGANRFHDVLSFVATRDFLDDKLIALSLANRIFNQADRPNDWLSKLKQAANGNPELEARLEFLLNPIKSQTEIDWEEKDIQRSEKRKRQDEERISNRTEWIERLKAAPNIVRHPPGLKVGEISRDQYRLLSEIMGEGLRTTRGGGNWKMLTAEFGESVAIAYRDACIALWRNFIPGLRSEGHDDTSIPYALILAMEGLEIESSELDGFPANLTEAEVRHVLRYLVWELNGFPSWLEKLHRTYPDLVLDFILAELTWELAHTSAAQSAHYILHDLVYSAPWIHQYLVTSITTWLEQYELINNDALGYCIQILFSGDASREIVTKLAQVKIADNIGKEQVAVWYALWVDLDAENGIPAVTIWLSKLSTEEASNQAQLFITRLMGTRRSSNFSLDYGDFRSVKHLKALYILMHTYVRAQEDIERAGKGVYSPELRDNAQDGRNALFNQLSAIPGKEAYLALSELATSHPDTQHRPWMRKLAYKRAEGDADLEAWSERQVRDYDQHQIKTPVTHRQLFELTVNRLIDLKAWVERGNESPYKTWQRVDGETEMRNLVAGWLNSMSYGRYTCAQENELPNRQRPDIWTQNANVLSPVPIELKLLDKSWSGPKLCERLRNQLAGDYLREESAGCGVMLLIWQGQSAKTSWRIGGQKITLTRLKEALTLYWDSISHSYPGIDAIEVIIIDLTTRDTTSED